jgi:hypothetical protein
MSCTTGRYCAAGGSYASSITGNTPALQALVMSKNNGSWDAAEEVPGTGALNGDGSAKTNSVSCTAVGDCLAGGWYTTSSDIREAWVATETNGKWGTAEEAPGTAKLNVAIPGAGIFSVSCPATGDCLAGGWYTNAAHHEQAFVVSETGGTWGTAQEVPGTAALNVGGQGQTETVSCASVGNCSIGGIYASGTNSGIPISQAWVDTETNGTWGTAEEVPGTSALNGGGYAVVNTVSCASAGNCSAGGEYTTSTPYTTQAFVVNETNGTWGTAAEVPGTGPLNTAGLAQISSISCVGTGSCSAGGFYLDSNFSTQAFVVNETGGTWGTAQEVPGTVSLDAGTPGAQVNSVSCASVGICSAGGYYSDSADHRQAFVVNETGGVWGTAEEVPGVGPLNAGGSASTAVVGCAPAGICSAGGSYTNAASTTQAFIVKETSG